MLYKVKASYKYQAEDVDELAFEVGEVINVVEYEDPEDQVLAKALPEKFFLLCNFTYLFTGGRLAYGTQRNYWTERNVPC